jgi:hypothetical protein
MRKYFTTYAMKVVVGGLLLMLSAELRAQVAVGAAAGANLNQLLTEREGQFPLKFGGQGGFITQIPTNAFDSTNLGLHPQIFYFNRNVQFNPSGTQVSPRITRFNYLDFALNFKWGIGRFIQLYSLGGPRISYLLGGETGARHPQGGTTTQAFTNAYDDWKEVYHQWQFGAQAGIGINMDLIVLHMRNPGSMPTKNLSQIDEMVRQGNIFLHLLYYHSLMDVVRQESSKFSTFYLNFGYVYKIPESNPDFFR